MDLGLVGRGVASTSTSNSTPSQSQSQSRTPIQTPTFIPPRQIQGTTSSVTNTNATATPTRKSRPSSSTPSRTSSAATLRSPSPAWTADTSQDVKVSLHHTTTPATSTSTTTTSSHRYQTPTSTSTSTSQPLFIRKTPAPTSTRTAVPTSTSTSTSHDPYATLDAMDEDELVTPRVEVAPTPARRRKQAANSTSSTSTSTPAPTSTSTSTSTATAPAPAPVPKRRPRPTPAPTISHDRSSLRDWITQHHQLQHRAQLIERELSHVWSTKAREGIAPGNNDLEIILECEKMAREGEKERQKEAKALFSDIAHIRSLVQKFRHHVEHVQEGDAYLITLRQAMEQVEDELSALKTRQREKFHKLATAEKDLSTEVTSLLSRLESFEQSTPIIVPDLTKPPSSRVDDTEHPHPEIAAIDAEIARDGGITGGWDQRDHDHFIKLTIQCSNDKQLIQRCIAEIPHQTAASVDQHIIWYHHYQELIKKKKQLIHEWREEKTRQEEEIAEKQVEERLEKEEQERKQKEEIAAKERAEKARQVSEWKQQKKQQQEAEMARQKAEAEAKAARKRQREEEEKARLKSIVESYQHSKETEQRIKQDKHNAPLDPATLHEREEAKRRVYEKAQASIRAAAEKRQAKLEEAAAAEARKQALIAASTPALADTRDPSRLIKLTAAQEKRKEEMKAELEAKKEKGNTKALVHERVMLGQ